MSEFCLQKRIIRTNYHVELFFLNLELLKTTFVEQTVSTHNQVVRRFQGVK